MVVGKTFLARKKMSWGALKMLSSHPKLDMNNVAVMGFSNGGSVTRNAAAFNPAEDTNGVLPKAFIMFYGGCHSRASITAKNYKPALLYVVGSKDKLVKASTCRERARDVVPPTDDIEVMVIDGAYHMFDGNTTRVINHPKWGTINLRANSGATTEARTKVVQLLNRVFGS